MEYLEFLNQIKRAVQEKTGSGAVVSVARVMKNNMNIVETLTIMADGANMSPAIYLQQFYEKYQKGHTIEELAQQILDIYKKHCSGGSFDLSFYTDYAKVRNKLACRLVNYEKNREMLEQVPHRPFMDLAVVYYCIVDNSQIGKGSILVQNAHLQYWGISEKTLDDVAMTNTVRLFPYELIHIVKILEDTFHFASAPEELGSFPLYVLTNTERYFGAVNIIFDSVLAAVAEKLQNNFYILPSSIHECMIVPAMEEIQAGELQQMVHSVNEEQVEEEEILGEMVYYYDRREEMLITA